MSKPELPATERSQSETGPKLSRRRKVLKRLRVWLARYPRVYDPVTRVWRAFKFSLLQRRWRRGAQTQGVDRFLDASAPLRLDPAMIVRCTTMELDANEGIGRVVPGDWDLGGPRFADLDVFRAVEAVVNTGARWEDTEFFANALRRVEAGEILWGCENRDELVARCARLDDLIASVRDNGFLSAEELRGSGIDWSDRPALTDVAVAIGRNGEVLFCDGAHRLAVAKVLDVPDISVAVLARHPEWIAFRVEMQEYADRYGGRVYQPPQHPDLADIPSFHNCETRYDLIAAAMHARGGRLLDIGTNWGYFCHRFEEAGFRCDAVEDSPENIYFLRRIAESRGREFRIIDESVLFSKIVRETPYDVVLALNIFHHFLKSEPAFKAFCDLLDRLQCSEMFFEPHLPDELQMSDAYRNMEPEEFVAFVSERTGLRTVELLGRDADGRSLYRLSRSED